MGDEGIAKGKQTHTKRVLKEMYSTWRERFVGFVMNRVQGKSLGNGKKSLSKFPEVITLFAPLVLKGLTV
ncbi:hypothetical protein Tco_1373479 [Tanacetum coccineum]